MSRPPLIRSKEDVKLKLSLLEALGDIQIAMTMLAADAGGDSKENPLDRHYKSLDCHLEPADKSSDEFKVSDSRPSSVQGHRKQYTLQKYNKRFFLHFSYFLSFNQLGPGMRYNISEIPYK